MQTTDRRDPLWYKDAVIYQAHVRAFFDSTNDGVGDFPGLTQKLEYLRGARHQHLVAAALLPVAAARRRLRHRRLREHPSELRHARRLRPLHGRGAAPRPPGHHRAGHQPHVGPASVVPGGAARPGRLARARLLRLERDQPQVRERPDHLHRYRDVELELGRHRQGVLLAPLLPPPAGSELRQSPGARGGQPRHAVLARPRRRRTAARRRALPDRARRHHLREPRGDPRHPEADAPGDGRPLSATGCSSPRRTSGRPTCAPISATATSATWRSTSR